jgi:superfamily II DNA or RNA helicase
VRDAYREGARRVVLVIPTGGGKTRIASRVVRLTVDRNRRALWIAHRTELIDQACETLGKLGLDVGAISAGSRRPERPSAPVQVASVQTLLARTKRPAADLIVWDEAHHCCEAAEEWSSLLAAYPDVRVLGLTATPERSDGRGLAPLFDALVVGATVRQLTAAGYLVPCEVVRPTRWLKHGKVKGNPLAWEPLAAYRANTPGESCILFASSIDEAERYAAEFTHADFRAISVSQRTSAVERAASIDAFKRGSIKVLCNVYVFTEGTDMPNASVCLMARGASTVGTVLQMVGRVLRPSPGKKVATWIDLQGVSHLHGMPEDERLFSLHESRAIRLAGDSVCPMCRAPMEAPPCSACGYNPSAFDREQAETVITGDALGKYARKLAEGPEQRTETLARWLVALALKGHVPGRVIYKWKAVYGIELARDAYFRGLADCTHSANEVVAEWARHHLKRIQSRRAA